MSPASALREFLARTPFFGGLSEGALDRVIGMLRPRSLAVGAVVFREGDEGRSMFVIVRGSVVVERAGQSGCAVRLTHLGPGDFFGEMALIEIQRRSSTVTVEQDATLHELTNGDLYALYQNDVEAYVMVLSNINRELCRRLRRADKRIAELADHADDRTTQIMGWVDPAKR